MPASLSNNDVLEATFVTRASDQNGLMINHYFVDQVVGNVLDTDVANALDTAFSPDIKALLSVNAEYRGVRVQVISPTRKDAVFNLLGAGAGTVVGDLLPAQVCGLISLRTGFAGRSRRGRKYVPFPSEAHSDASGDPVGAYQTLLGTLGTRYITVFNVIGAGGNCRVSPVIWHRTGSVGDAVNAYLVRNKWANRRSRAELRGGDQVII